MAERRYVYKPGGLLLRVLTVLLVLTALLAAVSAASSLLQFHLMQRVAAGEAVPDAEVEVNDLREAVIGFGQVPVMIAAAVAVFMSVYRANANAHALGARELTYTPGWSVGWFFVPILNLFKPYAALRETWRASDPAHAD